MHSLKLTASEYLSNTASSFGLLALAKIGDETQLAVAGFASKLHPVPAWLGATIALIGVSAIGVWAGLTVLQRQPVQVRMVVTCRERSGSQAAFQAIGSRLLNL